jgi:hypothetical protein
LSEESNKMQKGMNVWDMSLILMKIIPSGLKGERNSSVKSGKIAQSEDMANEISFLLSKKASDHRNTGYC